MKKNEIPAVPSTAQCPFCGDWFVFLAGDGVTFRPFGEKNIMTPFHSKEGREIHVDDRVGCGCVSDVAVRKRRGN